MLVSDIRPRWSGGLGGMKLGRIASVRSEFGAMMPPATFSASPAAAAAPASSSANKGKVSKREPSIEMPVMSFALIPEDVPAEGRPEKRRSSRETTPVEHAPAAAGGDAEAEKSAREDPIVRKESFRKEENVLRDSQASSQRESHTGRKQESESTPVKGAGSGVVAEGIPSRVKESPSR